MQYLYQAKNNTGEALSGIIDSQSISEARRSLRMQGLYVLEIASGGHASSSVGSRGKKSGRKRLKKSDVLMLTMQLKIMLQSGIDLAEALKNVSNNCKNPDLKSVLKQVYNDVTEGKSFSVALKSHADVFDDTFVASVAAGEASGTLMSILNRLAELLRNDIRLRTTIRSVLSYPAILILVSMFVSCALIFFVLPQFAKVFEDLGKIPPPLTKVLLDFGSFVGNNILYLAGGAVISAIVLWRFILTGVAKRYWDGFLLNNIILRTATRPLLTGRIFRLLGTMLQSGIPLLEAVTLCRSSVKNSYFTHMCDSLEQSIVNGKGIGSTLASFDFIPAGASEMVMTAEKTGKLGEVSEAIGEFYEDEGEENFRQISKLLEPAIIIFMGGIVAVVMLSIMIPLLDVTSVTS